MVTANSSKGDSNAKTGIFGFPAGFPAVNLAGGSIISKANQIVSDSMKTIWAKEVELAKLETEQAAKLFMPPKRNGDAREAATEYCSQLHEGSEKIVAEMRSLGDAMRDCGWQLFDLYAESFKRAE